MHSPITRRDTRDPLKIPCLTDRYWATLSDVPVVDVTRMLAFVKQHARVPDDLPRPSRVEAAGQVALERERVAVSLRNWGSGKPRG